MFQPLILSQSSVVVFISSEMHPLWDFFLFSAVHNFCFCGIISCPFHILDYHTRWVNSVLFIPTEMVRYFCLLTWTSI